MCSMCEAHINDAIRRNFRVRKVKADRKRKEAVIESEDVIDIDDAEKVIEMLGYSVIRDGE